MTISELFEERLRDSPNAPFLIDALAGMERSYAEVHAQSLRWSAFFQEQFRPGARMAVVLPNSLHFVELYLGAALSDIVL
jgi:acyl-CoA synthetase (AMP-forming)/AMP-acid ligase II